MTNHLVDSTLNTRANVDSDIHCTDSGSIEYVSCLDVPGVLADFDLIVLSASAGAGKTFHIAQSELLRFSANLHVKLFPVHNQSDYFWAEVVTLFESAGILKSAKNIVNDGHVLRSIDVLATELNKRSRQYTQTESFYIIFENAHVISDVRLCHEIATFVQKLNPPIKCLFTARNSNLYNIFRDLTDKNVGLLNENKFLLKEYRFSQILLPSASSIRIKTFSAQKIVSQIYHSVKGHVGLGLRCIESEYVQGLLIKTSSIGIDELCFRLVQTPEVHEYFKRQTMMLSKHELHIVALPLISEYLLNVLRRRNVETSSSIQGASTSVGLEHYLQSGFFYSDDKIDFYPIPLFSCWLRLNVDSVDEVLLRAVIDFYQQYCYWPQAIESIIKLGDGVSAIALICRGARYFSRRGLYEQARVLISQLPRTDNAKPLLLLLFENLLDFQQYGHQIASAKLKHIVDHAQLDASVCSLSKDDNDESRGEALELISILTHHYSCLQQPNKKIIPIDSLVHQPMLFKSNNPLCAWAWHGLAMEQVLNGDFCTGLESIIKAINQSFEQGDAPCALASLAWMVVPCVQQGKLSLALDYCARVEYWLEQKQFDEIAMVSSIHRVRVLIYGEQQRFDCAQKELLKMKTFYAELDPLNLAYCYWAEFVLSLTLQDLEQARKQLFILEGHAAVHFDGWALALPHPKLLSAILDTLAGCEIAMLNWASQFQLKYSEFLESNFTTEDMTPFLLPSIQTELIAYVRVRIILGSDMENLCVSLKAQALSSHNRLLEIHALILSLLNAHRQEKNNLQGDYRHQLLSKASSLEFRQVYQEYIEDLSPLLVDYQALPSESQGYDMIMNLDLGSETKCLDKSNSRRSKNNKNEDSLKQKESLLELTVREQQIALQVVKGLTNKEVAANLSITVATVKGHVSNIYNKLGVKRRSQLVNSVLEDPRSDKN
mgnify:CR=1 FL=1